jgi:hypothetical protein
MHIQCLITSSNTCSLLSPYSHALKAYFSIFVAVCRSFVDVQNVIAFMIQVCLLPVLCSSHSRPRDTEAALIFDSCIMHTCVSTRTELRVKRCLTRPFKYIPMYYNYTCFGIVCVLREATWPEPWIKHTRLRHSSIHLEDVFSSEMLNQIWYRRPTLPSVLADNSSSIAFSCCFFVSHPHRTWRRTTRSWTAAACCTWCRRSPSVFDS